MSQQTPKSFRLQIGLFGRRNVGKSSLLNALARQSVSIVSDRAGTTTDPVEKSMEFLPLGPVLFIDTAGIDDVGELGALRIEKTRTIFDRTDLGIIITEANQWTTFEEQILEALQKRKIPCLIVLNKIDLEEPSAATLAHLQTKKLPLVFVSIPQHIGLLNLREAILNTAPESFFNNPIILRDIVGPKEIVVQVMPIDNEAPKGRLLLPQVQAIRDALDGHAISVVVKESEFQTALDSLKHKPKLVVTDSSAFEQISRETPSGVLLTSFSILFARLKGDLISQVIDTLTLNQLKPGDRVLISESCSHHPITDDIGRVKVPRWMNRHVGGELDIHVIQGHDFPKDLSTYRFVVLCGGCMFNRREILTRILRCREAGVPCSNYGLTIAHCLGILERAIEPFPDALAAYRSHSSSERR
ncbi:MAG: [FeFe] hydrogenase H-cluster maturation GTPase HydF [Gammaproteobacteria bacterium GWE2_42_36]|nr:MAG: [FeFe] hydrogenase H-cluster maturation GTPase HydF [Gammaproteobacteria bacterium GWE2_42_36]HCU05954.1 [FeFe] hydrogenase H-cluster maturation GTPase HydF [Coxiellaceae bacterium]